MIRDNIEAIYRLSPVQEGILFHTIQSEASGVYVEQYSCTITGDLDSKAFHRAWELVVQRHPALRTFITWERRAQPLQIVRDSVKVPWTDLDWMESPFPAREARLKSQLEDDRRKGLDLAVAPLMHFTLIKLSPGTHRFIWTFHHIILDGWSMRLVFREVLGSYKAHKDGKELVLDPPRPYCDYIAWLGEQDLYSAEIFWIDRLSKFTEPTRFPPAIQRPRRWNSHTTYHRKHLSLSKSKTSEITSMAKNNGLTLNTLVMGAWALLLSRYSNQEDIIYGVTASGRMPSLSGIEKVIGLCINTLPMRIRLEREDVLLPWLNDVQRRLAEIREYEYTPLVNIKRWSEMPNDRPLFETILVFENHLVAAVPEQLGNIDIGEVEYLEQSNYPLALLAVPSDNLEFIAVYDSTQFSEATITRMLLHLQNLLIDFTKSPESRILDLALLDEEERHDMLVEWNPNTTTLPESLCIHQLIERRVEQTPDATAVKSGANDLTYGELNRRANQLARYLKSRGVGSGAFVGLYLERSADMIVGILGILKAGCAYVPLDPSYPAERIAFMIEDTRSSIVLIQEKFLNQTASRNCEVVCIDRDLDIIRSEISDNVDVSIDPANIAYVIYTSGSTGQPKGVLVTHRNLVYSTWARKRFYDDPIDNFLLLSSFAVDSSVAGIFWTLCYGGTLVLPIPGQERDTETIRQLVSSCRISHALMIPTLYAILLEFAESKDLESLRTVILAGETVAAKLGRRHYDLLPNARCYNEYGPSETTVWSAVFEIPSGWDESTVPIGRPIPNTEIYILDQYLRITPVGVPGELYIGGPGVTAGYLNCPDLTREKFIAHPFCRDSSERLYRTGDRAQYRADRNIEFLGRVDNQIKIRGYRVEPEEIETQLNQHPSVRSSVVVVRDKGEGTMDLVNVEDPEGLAIVLSKLPDEQARRILRDVEKLSEAEVDALLV